MLLYSDFIFALKSLLKASRVLNALILQQSLVFPVTSDKIIFLYVVVVRSFFTRTFSKTLSN